MCVYVCVCVYIYMYDMYVIYMYNIYIYILSLLALLVLYWYKRSITDWAEGAGSCRQDALLRAACSSIFIYSQRVIY